MFSDSDLLWLKIMSKLRAFGMSLEAIKTAKNQVEFLRDANSKRPLLDFYMATSCWCPPSYLFSKMAK